MASGGSDPVIAASEILETNPLGDGSNGHAALRRPVAACHCAGVAAR